METLLKTVSPLPATVIPQLPNSIIMLENPWLTTLLVITVTYILFIISPSIAWNLAILLFFVLLTLNILKYFFNIDISATFVNLFTNEPELDIIINKLDDTLFPDQDVFPDLSFGKGGTGGEEVFHINDNVYTYDDAKGICGAFGGRLANYFDIEKAYKKGGEWCNYGWSEDQMAFFPTQKATYERLKKNGRKNDCGRPGVNGGFIGNPDARFGVNCFGKKPIITPTEQSLMTNKKLAPQTPEEAKQQKTEQYWNERLGQLSINPFNTQRWNM